MRTHDVMKCYAEEPWFGALAIFKSVPNVMDELVQRKDIINRKCLGAALDQSSVQTERHQLAQSIVELDINTTSSRDIYRYLFEKIHSGQLKCF